MNKRNLFQHETISLFIVQTRLNAKPPSVSRNILFYFQRMCSRLQVDKSDIGQIFPNAACAKFLGTAEINGEKYFKNISILAIADNFQTVSTNLRRQGKKRQINILYN